MDTRRRAETWKSEIGGEDVDTQAIHTPHGLLSLSEVKVLKRYDIPSPVSEDCPFIAEHEQKQGAASLERAQDSAHNADVHASKKRPRRGGATRK